MTSLKKTSTSSKPQLRVDYRQSNEPFVVAHFIIECCQKLELDALTTATACLMYHSFESSSSSSSSFRSSTRFLAASAIISLAGKTQSPPLRLRDVVNVSHMCIHRDALKLDDKYYSWKSAVAQMELIVARGIAFRVKFDLPHKHLTHYLEALRNWISPEVWNKYNIASLSLCLLQDSYLDGRVHESCKFANFELALAAIFVALKCFGIEVPFMGREDRIKWFQVLYPDVEEDRLWTIGLALMDVYSEKRRLIDPILKEI